MRIADAEQNRTEQNRTEQNRTVYHWKSRRDDRAITLRIHIQLQREGWLVNYKKHTGFTVWKASTCAESVPADMSVQHIASNVRS